MAEDRTFEQIMQEITSGLTGDFKSDYKYLDGKAKEYKDHKYGQEICRAIGRIIAQNMPDDIKNKINEEIGKHDLGIQSTLEEVQFNQYKGNFDKAIELIEPLVKKLEEIGFFKDDAVSEYHTFESPLEEILYQYYTKPTKDIRYADFPLATVYTQYGSSLIDVERWDEARKALKEALHWNPASASIAFEYAETFKHSGELDEFLKITLDTFKYCYTPHTLARAFRNLGWYFIEKELYEDAMVAYVMSVQYEHDEHVQSELYYITQKTGKEFSNPTIEQIRACAEKYGFPVGADENIVGIAFQLGKQAIDDNQKDSAKYFLNIAYELTEAEEIKKLIDGLDK